MTAVVGAWVALMAIGALVATGRALRVVSELECMAENMAAPSGCEKGRRA